MFSGACLVLIILTIPETHQATILKHIAQEKRKSTGDQRWHAQIERKKITLGQRAKIILLKPWQVFFSEPMLIAVTIYLSFIYGCLVGHLFLFSNDENTDLMMMAVVPPL